MPNMSEWLDRKYSNLEAQTRNQQLTSEAGARLTNTQANLAPGEAAARNALMGSQARVADTTSSLMPAESAARNAAEYGSAAQSTASAGLMGTNAAWVGPRTQADIDLTRARVGDQNINNALNMQQFNPASPGVLRASGFVLEKNGTARVPGQGDGRTDTQPAMLAPGEAVLNRAAAEHLGRDTIELLNALGKHKMDLEASAPAAPADQQASGQPAAPGYADGTAGIFPVGPNPMLQPGWQGGDARQLMTSARVANEGVSPAQKLGTAPSFAPSGNVRAFGRWLAGDSVGGGAGSPAATVNPADQNRVNVIRGGMAGYAEGTARVPTPPQRPSNLGAPKPPSIHAQMAQWDPVAEVMATRPNATIQPRPPADIPQAPQNTPLPPQRPASMPAGVDPQDLEYSQMGGTVPHFAKGTAKVPAKGSAKGSAKAAPAPQEQMSQPMPQPGPAVGGDGGRGGLNAHVLAALAQMGGGGGGMPAPGAAPPMPMPMPQVGARRATV
jgi:hypothetical protein